VSARDVTVHGGERAARRRIDPEPSIGPAVTADRGAVLDLWLALVAYHREIDPEYPSLPGLREALSREIDRVLASREARILVARDARGAARGFLLAELECGGPESGSASDAAQPVCWIHELYVEPPYRRSGVGSRLVASAEALFRARCGGRLAVRVEAKNVAGLRFWERRGFDERARVLERRED
jgi:GNAT superfamily N-acetyltransferase